jgi:hypothetical protein
VSGNIAKWRKNMDNKIVKINIADNLDLVSEEISLVAIVQKMAKEKNLKPSVLARRLIQENKEFRGYLAAILTGEHCANDAENGR